MQPGVGVSGAETEHPASLNVGQPLALAQGLLTRPLRTVSGT